MTKVTVVIPTYNERENIGSLIEALEEEFQALPKYEATILVVDDNSPDGTQLAVAEKQIRWSNIQILTGEKKGLGAAYIRGLRRAMERFQPEIIVTSDADFSHDPRDVKRLLVEIERGADFVIGSRYVRGGSIPVDWGWHRKFLSFFGNLTARILGVHCVHDATPAFRAVRVPGILEKIDLESLPGGYANQIALVCRAADVGAKFAEVPVNFVDRKMGKSKMPLSTFFEALGFLLKYRLGKITRSSGF